MSRCVTELQLGICHHSPSRWMRNLELASAQSCRSFSRKHKAMQWNTSISTAQRDNDAGHCVTSCCGWLQVSYLGDFGYLATYSVGTVLKDAINLLKTKRNLLYIRNQTVPRCKHFLPRLYPISLCCTKQKPLSVLRSVQNTQRKASTM